MRVFGDEHKPRSGDVDIKSVAYEGTSDLLYNKNDETLLCQPKDILEDKKFGFPKGKIKYNTYDSETGETTTHFDFPDALPLVETNTTFLVDRSFRSQASSKHTLTFTGKVLGLPAAGPTSATKIFNIQNQIRKDLRDNKYWHIKIVKDETLCEFANCRLISIDFAAGRYYNSADYTMTFESTELATDDLETYTTNIDVSDEEGMGYVQAGNLVSSSHYVAKVSLTGTSLDAHKAAHALRLIAPQNNDIVMLAGDTRTFKARNVKSKDLKIDPTSGSVTLNYDMVLVPTNVEQNYVVGLQTEVSRSADGVTLDVQGQLKSLASNLSIPAVFNTFQESLFNIVKNTASLTENEEVRDATSPLSNYSSNKRGSDVSHSLAFSEHSDVINFNYEYEVSDKYKLTNTVYERITISHDRPHAAISTTPILGKLNGPLLQSLSSDAAGRKTLSIEATFVKGKNIYTEWQSLQGLIVDETPQGDVAFDLALEDSWESSPNKVQASMEWAFTNSYIFPTIADDCCANGMPVDYITIEEKTGNLQGAKVDIVDMWQPAGGGNQPSISKQFFNVNPAVEPGYGAYHYDLFNVSTDGAISWAGDVEDIDYEKRNVYLIRIKCKVTRLRDQKKFTYYTVLRILVKQYNEEAGVDEPMTHVVGDKVVMVSNKTVFPYMPAGIVVAEVELTDPDFLALDHDGPLGLEHIPHPIYSISGGQHEDLFTMKGRYLMTDAVLVPETDTGGSVEDPLQEYNITVKAYDGKYNYTRDLDIKVLYEQPS